ncbi:Rib/alpha-like domain-containing protein [uncultured Corynebacterium sp.]|mgnify:FL=1|uniref:Rib/alpha-like domain-containing protein n=1 Tax=uncultured Corynebacterium sp. TaxID=159447 RepID=UPI0025F56030|nr:Rib/alpha-like domain-containing protein [uncultured Corynebacterium sp.]
MQRFALPAVVVVAAGLLAPAASAAMSDEYSPHFDPAPRHVHFIPSDGYTETTEYELLGVPEGTVWKQTGEDTLRNKAQLFNGERDYVSQPLAVRLNNYTREAPPQPGENVIEFSIRVKFPDGSHELYPQKIKLTSDDAFYYNPVYDALVPADPGQTVTLTPQNQFHLDLPTNAKWKVTGGQGWDWSIDQATGTITAKVPTDSYSDANFEVVTVFEDGSERRTWTAIENSGKDVTLPEDPAPQPEAPAPAQDGSGGSSTGQKLGLVFGVLALLVGAAAFAWPQLQHFLPKM